MIQSIIQHYATQFFVPEHKIKFIILLGMYNFGSADILGDVSEPPLLCIGVSFERYQTKHDVGWF